MTKTLYLMRHGQTLFNQLHLIQGWCDSPLTENGIKQAKLARDFFENESIAFDHLYTSTSERCSDTLELASGRTDYHRLKGLKEWNFGRMEGQSEFLHPNRRPDQVSHEDFYVQYDGEGEEEVRARLHETVTSLVADMAEGETSLAVSHAGACMQFLLSLALTEYPELHFSNCCIFHYEITDGQWDLVRIIDPVNQAVYRK